MQVIKDQKYIDDQNIICLFGIIINNNLFGKEYFLNDGMIVAVKTRKFVITCDTGNEVF